jgi:hypothetical protein
MPFVKVDTSLRHNVRLQRISESAEVAYRRSMEFAQELADAGTVPVGALVHASLGPLSVREIATSLVMPEPKVRAALTELVAAGLWAVDDGVVSLCRFAEKTAAHDPSAAERVRRFRARARDRNAVTPVTRNADVTPDVTDDVTACNGVTVTENVTDNVTASNGVTPVTSNGTCNGDVTQQKYRSKNIPPLTPPGGTADEENRRESGSLPWKFAEWLLGRATELGLVEPIVDLAERDKRVRADLVAAKSLLEHGSKTCHERAQRFLTAMAAGDLRIAKPTVRGLKSVWEMPIVAQDLPRRNGGGTPVVAGSILDAPARIAPEDRH